MGATKLCRQSQQVEGERKEMTESRFLFHIARYMFRYGWYNMFCLLNILGAKVPVEEPGRSYPLGSSKRGTYQIQFLLEVSIMGKSESIIVKCPVKALIQITSHWWN